MMMRNQLRWARCAVAIGSMWVAASAFSQATTPSPSEERAQLEAIKEALSSMVKALAAQGVLQQDKADEILKLAVPKPVESASPPPLTAAQRARGERPGAGREPVRVQFVPESVKAEMREQIKQEIVAQARNERWGEAGTLPDWLERFRFEGDIRIRQQSDRFADGNAPAALLYDDSFAGGAVGTNYADLTNSQVDRNRFRIRARLGATVRLGEEWGGGIRLSTGSILGPVSTSSTSGDPNDRFGLKMDRAFLRYTPREWLAITGGRMQNPYFSSELQFAPDLGFDGLAAVASPSFGTEWKGLLAAGVFMLRENPLGSDRRLTGVQVGAEWRPSTQIGARLAIGNYRYTNVRGQSDTTNFGTPQYANTEYERGFRAKGNTLFRINNALQDTGAARWGLASGFDIQSLTGSLELAQFDPITLILTGEMLRNNGFDASDILARTGFNVTPGTKGRLLRAQIGHRQVRDRHDWQLSLGYRHLEKDAVLDAFTDPDFMLGGTNVRGYTLGLAYGLDRNVALGARWLSGRQIEGPQFNVDTMQLDLNMRF